MKVLKSVFLALLLHLYIQLDMFAQLKLYDSGSFLADGASIMLPAVFGVVTYFLLKKIYKKPSGIFIIAFAALCLFFVVLHYDIDYFTNLYGAVDRIYYYDRIDYELRVNAVFDGILHIVSFIVTYVIYMIRNNSKKGEPK